MLMVTLTRLELKYESKGLLLVHILYSDRAYPFKPCILWSQLFIAMLTGKSC
jgi:hypothetical protein